MRFSVIGPTLIAALLLASATLICRRLRPRPATWVLTSLTVMVTLAVVWALSLFALAFAVQHPGLTSHLTWCHHLGVQHRHVPVPLGLAAWGLLVLMGVSALRQVHEHRKDRTRMEEDARELQVLPQLEPTAFVLPGRPGRIVVSAGMLRALDVQERRVLLAHERSHLDRHHHRFIHLTDLATGALPLLRPIQRHVRFAVERWADEDAAAAVGDRRLVARALSRAAVATAPSTSAAVAFGHLGVIARVEALLHPQEGSRWLRAGVVAAGVLAVSIVFGGSALQLHHFVEFAAHLC
jgi:Zn-dependent protease with chaperone function